MSIAACIIDLNNSAWIMISVAMICATVILCKCIPIWSRSIRLKKSQNHSCNKTTTIKYKDDEVVISDEENDKNV